MLACETRVMLLRDQERERDRQREGRNPQIARNRYREVIWRNEICFENTKEVVLPRKELLAKSSHYMMI